MPAMLSALIAGEAGPAAMAKLARGRLRKKEAQLAEALAGRLDPHHRDLLAMQLARVKGAEADIAALDRHIAERLVPYQDKVALSNTIRSLLKTFGLFTKRARGKGFAERVRELMADGAGAQAGRGPVRHVAQERAVPLVGRQARGSGDGGVTAI